MLHSVISFLAHNSCAHVFWRQTSKLTLSILGFIVAVQSLSCTRLFGDPMDHRPPGSSVHGISQARVLEWVAIFFSRQIRYQWATREAPRFCYLVYNSRFQIYNARIHFAESDRKSIKKVA